VRARGDRSARSGRGGSPVRRPYLTFVAHVQMRTTAECPAAHTPCVDDERYIHVPVDIDRARVRSRQFVRGEAPAGPPRLRARTSCRNQTDRTAQAHGRRRERDASVNSPCSRVKSKSKAVHQASLANRFDANTATNAMTTDIARSTAACSSDRFRVAVECRPRACACGQDTAGRRRSSRQIRQARARTRARRPARMLRAASGASPSKIPATAPLQAFPQSVRIGG
jgi:hypothetical protein